MHFQVSSGPGRCSPVLPFNLQGRRHQGQDCTPFSDNALVVRTQGGCVPGVIGRYRRQAVYWMCPQVAGPSSLTKVFKEARAQGSPGP